MKALDQWARDYGFNDFDTFIRTGGSLREARRNIEQRSRTLEDALNQLAALQIRLPAVEPKTPAPHLEEAKRAETEDEPPDSENAQVQGAELA